jgi:hypothetical protein
MSETYNLELRLKQFSGSFSDTASVIFMLIILNVAMQSLCRFYHEHLFMDQDGMAFVIRMRNKYSPALLYNS